MFYIDLLFIFLYMQFLFLHTGHYLSSNESPLLGPLYPRVFLWTRGINSLLVEGERYVGHCFLFAFCFGLFFILGHFWHLLGQASQGCSGMWKVVHRTIIFVSHVFVTCIYSSIYSTFCSLVREIKKLINSMAETILPRVGTTFHFSSDF